MKKITVVLTHHADGWTVERDGNSYPVANVDMLHPCCVRWEFAALGIPQERTISTMLYHALCGNEQVAKYILREYRPAFPYCQPDAAKHHTLRRASTA